MVLSSLDESVNVSAASLKGHVHCLCRLASSTRCVAGSVRPMRSERLEARLKKF
jgi:hypothetical protein